MTSGHIALRKAAEMALEALDSHYRIDGAMDISNEKKGTTFAIAALREVLAQSEQEPVAWMSPTGDIIVHTKDVSYTPNWTDYYTIPLYLHPTPIPEGWQLVPKEPTVNMLTALYYSERSKGYAAMLAAAPKYEEQSK